VEALLCEAGRASRASWPRFEAGTWQGGSFTSSEGTFPQANHLDFTRELI
jgi:hypothetical protein